MSNQSPATQSPQYEVGIILPTYNFFTELENSLEAIDSWRKKEKIELFLCVVNDGSSDASETQYEELLRRYSGPFKIIHQKTNQGKGQAVKTGFFFLEDKAEFSFFADCDLYYGLSVISERMLPALRSGQELVILDRSWQKQFHSESSVRRLASRVFNHLKTILTGVYLKDSQAGLKGFRNDRFGEVFRLCRVKGFAFDVEVLSLAIMYRFKIEIISILDKKRGQKQSSTVRFASAALMTIELLSIFYRRFKNLYESEALRQRVEKEVYQIRD